MRPCLLVRSLLPLPTKGEVLILYNTLMGVLAGTGMLLTVHLVANHPPLSQRELQQDKARGYGAAYLVLGIPLAVLAGAMTLTWPLHVNPPINIAFGEPSLMLGILMTVAGFTLSRNESFSLNPIPIGIIVMVVGVMLLVIASAIFSYNLVGDAPPQEPITGQFKGWENTTFGLAYALAGFGCLLLPRAMRGPLVIRKLCVAFLGLSGFFFLAFSLLNYRTHIGFLINIERGTNYRW